MTNNYLSVKKKKNSNAVSGVLNKYPECQKKYLHEKCVRYVGLILNYMYTHFYC